MMALSPTGALSTVIRDLAPLDVGYALVGGLAVSASKRTSYDEPRASICRESGAFRWRPRKTYW